MNKKTLAQDLRRAVEVLDEAAGCYEIPLEGKLSVFVGWMLNGDDEAEMYELHAGIKVNTSDDMKTDYEYLNSPFYESGDVWSTDVVLAEDDEDYDKLAEYFIKEFEAMKKFDLDDNGRITNSSSLDECCFD